MLIDTHTHIHESDFPLKGDEEMRVVLRRAANAGVKRMALVGTSVASSREAVIFIQKWRDFAEDLGIKFVMTAGIHPHYADPKLQLNLADEARKLSDLTDEIRDMRDIKLSAIGEIGLDYYYDFAFRERQIKLFEPQLELAQELALPISFHIRDFKDPDMQDSVWRDFWQLMDDPKFVTFGRQIPLIFHSYTEQSRGNLARILALPSAYFGVNGISTFAKSSEQGLWRELPLERIILETDAPDLAPKGFRGKTNEPAYILEIAQNLAKLRQVSFQQVAQITTANAEKILKF